MLRLCIGSIRNYAREIAIAGRQPNRPTQRTIALPKYTGIVRTDSDTLSDSDSFSDASNDDNYNNLSEARHTGFGGINGGCNCVIVLLVRIAYKNCL